MSLYKILALSGGGIRGVVSATILVELEKELGAPLGEHFDLIAGTSTGSLLALGLAKGHSATELLDFYFQDGIDIFPNFWNWLPRKIKQISRDGLSRTLFDDSGLERAIKNRIGGNVRFGELKKPLIVTAYDIWNQAAVVFKNTKVEHASIPAWEICRASCAYPGVFPAHLLTDEIAIKDHLDGGICRSVAPYNRIKGVSGVIPLIDGGFIAGNPGVCGLAERLRWNHDFPEWNLPCPPPPKMVDLKDIVVVQVNTGRDVQQVSAAKSRQWGLGAWQLQSLTALFTGNNLVTDYALRQQLGDNNCFYLQPPLSGPEIKPPIVANERHYSAMQNQTLDYLRGEGKPELNKLVRRLNSANFA